MDPDTNGTMQAEPEVNVTMEPETGNKTGCFLFTNGTESPMVTCLSLSLDNYLILELLCLIGLIGILGNVGLIVSHACKGVQQRFNCLIVMLGAFNLCYLSSAMIGQILDFLRISKLTQVSSQPFVFFRIFSKKGSIFTTVALATEKYLKLCKGR